MKLKASEEQGEGGEEEEGPSDPEDVLAAGLQSESKLQAMLKEVGGWAGGRVGRWVGGGGHRAPGPVLLFKWWLTT